ncbi:MAG TPA: S53 family peptidase [Mycobacterium sp.]|uniref:S53 family peptidase n=1 Tax=Mycobacterium sp. TaxID=1785 RepID=UPI002BD4A364|nr:S53 family peptidase [Mycobacterium sp.]HME74732.1 S53 family peptidase [Mycobacterium sp.]
MSDTHAVLPGTDRPAPADARRVGDVDPRAHVEVTVVLKAPELPSPDKMPAKALTPAKFTKKYGADPEDIGKVEDSLRSYGLHIDGVGATGRSLRVSGTAADMESAFHADMGIYHSPEYGEFRGRAGSIKAPAEIADLVEAVLGLDQRPVARRAAAQPAVTLEGPGFTPADIEGRYNFPPGDCAGQKIAIVEFGAPLTSRPPKGKAVKFFAPPVYFADDLAQYCQRHGRPVPVVKPVGVNNFWPFTGVQLLTASQLLRYTGPVLTATLNAASETMMDVQIVAALCPAAEISVYYATWDQQGWYNLLDQVHADAPHFLSISYGLAEDSPDWAEIGIQTINDLLAGLALIGVTACVSSGDDGTNCQMSDTNAHVEFPASSPYVLSVGGTMLTLQRPDNPFSVEEVVWNQPPGRRTDQGGGSTGGGVSGLFPRPPWQTVDIASLNPPSADKSFKGRIVPDVAALAGPPLYSLVFGGLPKLNGGTSASTPVWASLLARINAALPAAKRRRLMTPLLYQNNVSTEGFIDIVTGDNAAYPNPGKGYSAAKGFDAVTGWGIPDGQKLLSLLAT